jgi:ATP-dependent Lon protease
MGSQFFYIASVNDIEARVDELKYASSEIKARLAPVLKSLWNPSRELRDVTNLAGFNELRTRFQNFSEAIDMYEANAKGLARIGEPYEAQPALLVGEPGLGKTLFAHELAKVLGLPYYEIALSTVTAGFSLSGGSIQWAEGAPGFISASLSQSMAGNPLFTLDEIDKCNFASKYNPMSVFYTLLERHTAARFVDEALGFSLDASRIVWVATANDINLIPDAILSRLRVIEVHKPNEDAMRAVISSVYGKLRKERPYGRLLDEELGDDVISSLSNLLPRAVRQALEDGMLKAIMAMRDHIIVEDLPVRKGRRRAGFN